MIVCPHCAAEHADDPRNRPGAVDLCIVCGEWMVYLIDGARGALPAEKEAIASLPKLVRLRAAWERMQRQVGNQPDSGGFTF